MRFRKLFVTLLIVAAVMVAAVGPATAHETQTVEGYELTFGGADEPVITGERMWLEIEIVDEETGEPVEGQADSLEVSIQQAGGEKVEWNVSEKHGEPGVYEAAVIFTEPGDYVVHVEGTIEDTEVHTHFEKEVHDHNDLEYPPKEESTEEEILPGFSGTDTVIAAGIAAVALLAVGTVVLRR